MQHCIVLYESFKQQNFIFPLTRGCMGTDIFTFIPGENLQLPVC